MKIARVFPRKLSEFTGAQTTKDGFEPRRSLALQARELRRKDER